MASRESQGYLIAVIILTVLLIVFSVVSYLMYAQSNDYFDQYQSATLETAKVQKQADANWNAFKLTQAYLGVPGVSLGNVDDFKSQVASKGDDAIKKDVEATITAYENANAQRVDQIIDPTSNDAKDTINLAKLISDLTDVVGEKHRQLGEELNRYKELQRTTNSTINTIKEQLTKAQNEKATLQTQFDEAKKTYAQNLTDLQNAAAENKAQIQAKSQELDKKITEANNMKKTLTDEKNVLAEDNRKLKMRIEQLTSTNNSIPDGRVIKVNKDGDQVSVNLGELDGLRIKQNFTVYDRDETNFETARPKAKIEIIRVTGPHMAVARIHEQQVGNPILADDHILSPTWDPGFKVPIAIAGFIDLDGDGKSDRLRFEGLVRQNGGLIIAQHDEDGNRRGDIDFNTRFLVVGETPPADSKGAAKIMESMSFYDRQANDFNVQKMSVRRFMNWMAVPMRGRIEPLDKFIGQPKSNKFQPRSAFDRK